MEISQVIYNDAYEAEIREIIRINPKNYVKVLKSKGFKGRCPDRTYLVDYIYACTPMLNDDTHTFKTRIYWAINRISDFPVCGNDAHGQHKMLFTNVKKLEDGYPQYCDSKCQHEAPSYHEKTKRAIVEKYGVENAFQIAEVKKRLAEKKEEIQSKRDATRRSHFGDRPGWNLEKSIETRRKKYGSAWNQTAVRETKARIRGNPNWNNPAKNTETKRKNGTFNESKTEKVVVELFTRAFGEIKTQYSSKEYPYRCDIYIPSVNVYVEYNGTWTHGGHAFDPASAEDIAMLEKWKAKETKYYQNAIETWTERDVEKRKAASANGLNYVELWNMEDVRRYLGISQDEFDNKVEWARAKVLLDDERRCRKEDAERMFDAHGRQAFDVFRTYDFPYIAETDASARYELRRLVSKQTKDQTPSRLIKSFHRSMFSCRRRGMVSPREYWSKMKDESYFSSGEWHDFYVNRFVYAESKPSDAMRATGIMDAGTALDGLTVTHRADCVSYLKPMLAKRLVTKYLPECAEVFCPFNGFSGIMLGAAVGCGVKFIGHDISKRQIDESERLAEYVRKVGFKCDADFAVADVFESSGEYESLFCCPPYEDLEMWNFASDGRCVDKNMSCEAWIDLCLQNFKCRKYLFVVDDKTVGKYFGNIVEELDNRSHFGHNKEYVVMIDYS